MNRLSAIILILVMNLIGADYSYARESKKRIVRKGPIHPDAIAANCSPATASTELDINNTKALIQSGGDMWWDFNTSRYEIPKGSGRTSLFAGSLWMGGQDPSGQIKVAAQRFRGNGNDFWTGPLSTTTAEIGPETCREYDRHFVTTRDEVARFNAWWEAGLQGTVNGVNVQQANFPGYQVPRSILEWPAHGRNFEPYNEDFNLAPFVDRDGDGFYDPLGAGDYPGYDLKGEGDCNQKISDIYGDQNIWWVFNDKGNIHTETGAQSIGVEIRAQAFAFATNDEVNNMTFYNYEIINRSTFTLTNTYFAQWADGDLGNAEDDYVGCDVERGLGYFYNGNGFDADAGGNLGYGDQPPAIGIDFFQGPFQDNDDLDNPLTTDIQLALSQGGIPYKGIGIGYGDGVPDNERFGMRRFLYHNNGGPNDAITDPMTGTDYYNYMRGIWLDGSRMVFGGNGWDPNNPSAIPADYMFPGDSDPLHWGTRGIDPGLEWTEEGVPNQADDRRFAQSAGPFTLAPGAVNNITVGVVWARAKSGGPLASVEAVRRADDKTQKLFDTCFELFSGPDAPDITVQELDREIILYLSNPIISNNYQESFNKQNQIDLSPPPALVDTNNNDTGDIALTEEEIARYYSYKFQGYQIYQLIDASVSADELEDRDRARPVAQCDIEDDIVDLINYEEDDQLGANVPKLKVTAENKGIRHSFKITEDKFAQGDNRLINHKTYYYMAIAYAHNLYGDDFGNLVYIEEEYDTSDPDKLDGQKEPYVASRKAASGGIRVYTAIPHKTEPESGGSRINAEYGDGVELTRVEGQGNGGYSLNIQPGDYEKMFSENTEGDVDSKWTIPNPTYEAQRTPIEIKVIDPLNVPKGDFTIWFEDSTETNGLGDAVWKLAGEAISDTIVSEQNVEVASEQLILDLGISVKAVQVADPATENSINNGFIEGTIEFEDERRQWLSGVSDVDGCNPANWIRSGTNDDPDNSECNDYEGIDDDQVYEGILNGTWAPSRLVSYFEHGPLGASTHPTVANLDRLNSVDVIFTSDKDKWTRAAVIEVQDESELAEGGAEKGFLRAGRSIDKDGNVADTSDTVASRDPNHPNYIGATGMGWFPGYAIDVETGERLNIAYGEDSWLEKENGRDMKWNPTSTLTEGFFNDVRFGGKHFIYVFRRVVEDHDLVDTDDRMPAYDAGKFIHTQISNSTSPTDLKMLSVYLAASWVGFPMLAENQDLLSNEVRVKLRVSKPYRKYASSEPLDPSSSLALGTTYYVLDGPITHDTTDYETGETFTAVTSSFTGGASSRVAATIKDGNPLYSFNLNKLSPTINNNELAESALDLINIVPNPYYAYSQYETNRLDNRVKIVNLPQSCTITIYSVNGTLIRSFKKDDPTITSVDWDLKNHANIPIASGMYIIHVDVPGVGEKVLKWLGMLRPVDLDSF